MLPPAVALVPGFFGFDHRESQTYFADRFIAGVRSGLEARGLHGVPVLAVSTLGIASMHKRQIELLSELTALEADTPNKPSLRGARAWHLVGHSTGGVDAALLLRPHPLAHTGDRSVYGSGGWDRWEPLVQRVRSVTSVSAPHYGTALAESALARFATGHPTPAAVRDLARAAWDLAHRGDFQSRLAFAFNAMPSLTQVPLFLAQLLISNDLARDLRPSVMSELARVPVRSSIVNGVFSVVTVAPRPEQAHTDQLFRDMWRWVHDGTDALHGAVDPPRATLDDRALRLDCQRDIELPPIDGGDNDGVVSSTRQALGSVLAVVVGDHVDVLGRYRRTSLIDGRVIDPGLLTSGAEFGDNEFFALIDVIAANLATRIRASAEA